MLNLRGSDIDYNPVFFSYVIIGPNSVHFFVEESKITGAVRDHFNQEELTVTFHPYDKVYSFLTEQVIFECLLYASLPVDYLPKLVVSLSSNILTYLSL